MRARIPGTCHRRATLGACGPGNPNVSGPAWFAGSFAVLMIVIAVYCAGRLAISRRRGRDTELDTDALHVLMGVAMAGMFEPRLTPIPVIAWRAVFAAAAAWFAWQAIRAGVRSGPVRCAHRAAHAVESAAMVYMLLPVGSWPSGHGAGMAMPGMSQGATTGNPALTLVLALFMLGYVLWAIDRLAWLSRTMAAATAQRSPHQPIVPGDHHHAIRRSRPSPGWPWCDRVSADGARPPARRLLQDRHGHHHGVHAHHDALRPILVGRVHWTSCSVIR